MSTTQSESGPQVAARSYSDSGEEGIQPAQRRMSMLIHDLRLQVSGTLALVSYHL